VTIADMQSLATKVIDQVEAFQGGPNFPFSITGSFVSVRVTDLTTISGPAFDWVHGTTHDLPFPGIFSGAPQGAQVAAVVTWQTTARGRSYRGRSFLPCLEATHIQDADNLTTAAVTLYQDFWQQMHDGINAASAGVWTHVVVSRFTGHVARPAGVMTPIAFVRQNQSLGTIRKRSAQ
jgi:hypothetical protein